ncbi:MAG: phosphodiesterase [Limnochordia bacterium]|jgi:putative phosphoesterase
MNIGVISDTHGSVEAWERAMNTVFRHTEMILHAGDVLYHGARNPLPGGYATSCLAERLNECQIPIVIARGNCDSEVDQVVIQIPMQAPFALVEAPWGRLLLTHGHRYDSTIVRDLAKKYRVRVWISGHTHIPLLEERDGTIFLNPGSPSLPKGAKACPTVGLITNDRVSLVELATGTTLHAISLSPQT